MTISTNLDDWIIPISALASIGCCFGFFVVKLKKFLDKQTERTVREVSESKGIKFPNKFIEMAEGLNTVKFDNQDRFGLDKPKIKSVVPCPACGCPRASAYCARCGVNQRYVVKTVVVKSHAFDGHIRINETDFNPRLHEKVEQ